MILSSAPEIKEVGLGVFQSHVRGEGGCVIRLPPPLYTTTTRHGMLRRNQMTGAGDTVTT